ncbi:DUF805 domain-containing protein [Prevotella sp. kh1p2]|uniref:DUF805 domain-containing protein n=1 Tax=Prevotella sp. kh1p2 TaxID=1761883 RepID=UPI0008AD9E0D|nr:DUF805 domain-containing protein [Prevotella sp. kh1p2]SES95670.1 Protein of unknown function [Prevotella sp. kh1p2]SNU11300.1 Protein of unknown function [Prevotellaceae bacterium KH2P17]
MEQFKARPRLGFSEAVKLALGRLTDFNSRSRRSEFWWFFLPFCVFSYVLNFVLELFLPLTVTFIISCILSLLALAVTVRRLQDGGHSKWWVFINFAASVVFSAMFVTSGAMEAAQSVNPDVNTIMDFYKSPVAVVSMLVAIVTGLPIIVFCFMDGKKETNRYGESPKYYLEQPAQTAAAE